MIQYSVSFEQADNHLFTVKLTVDRELEKGQQFYLPNWIPGSYKIRDFAKNIVSLQAFSNEEKVLLKKINKSTWVLEKNVASLTIEYQVYAWDLSVRTAHLDNQHGFFNGTSLFLGVKGFESQAHHVVIHPNKIAQDNNWCVATAMQAVSIDDKGFGHYVSQDYDEVIDHPFEIADQTIIEFDVCGVNHKMYFTEAPNYVDWQRIKTDVKKICETQVDFFGDKKPPFSNYVFMTFVQKNGFGGLEHRASTALHCSFSDLPLITEDPQQMSDGYRTFLSLCCHEYFHNWNVKRIKPEAFLPIDPEKENYTEMLWFFEGITSYYDELLMARADVVSAKSYLDMLAKSLTKVYRSQGRHKQSLAESSFEAWTKFYQQDENAINSIISYYSKGGYIALCLDFEIRQLTNNQKSLDDLMTIIWNKHGKTQIGLSNEKVQEYAEELTKSSLSDFFQQAIYTTQDFDLEKMFAKVGVDFQLLSPYTHNEKGGFCSKPKQRKSVPSLGITHTDHSLGVQVQTVVEGSCAAQAGISNGDIIIAIDYVKVTASEIDKTVASIPMNEDVTISYFRRDRLFETKCKLVESSKSICYLSLQDENNPNFKSWIFNQKS